MAKLTAIIAALAAPSAAILTADRTYYVRTDGNDANTGLADNAGGAFLTVMRAFDVIGSKIIIPRGITVTVQVRDGTYSADVRMQPFLGGGEVVLKGNVATPANVVIDGHLICFGKHFTVESCKVQGGINCISAMEGGYITIGVGMIFGSPQANGAQLNAEDGGTIFADEDYEIVDDAEAHYRVRRHGTIQIGATNVTITGAPSFTYFAEASHAAVIESAGTAYTGAVTAATRYHVSSNAVIDTQGGGGTHFPGTIVGVAASGGQYL